jgi:hypothetical protein
VFVQLTETLLVILGIKATTEIWLSPAGLSKWCRYRVRIWSVFQVQGFQASLVWSAASCKMNHARRQEVNVFAWLTLLVEYVLTARDTVLCTAWTTLQFVSACKIRRVPSWTNLIYSDSQAWDVDPLTNNVYQEGMEVLNTVCAQW